MFSKNSPTVKANIINNMPSNIIDCISNKFNKYLGNCLKSNKKISVKSTKKLFTRFKKFKKSRKYNKKNKKFSYFY